MSAPHELDPCDGASGKARCTWQQLEQASGEVRVVEGDAGGPLLVERRTMDRIQTWRRWMTDEKGRTGLELVEEKTADAKLPTANASANRAGTGPTVGDRDGGRDVLA